MESLVAVSAVAFILIVGTVVSMVADAAAIHDGEIARVEPQEPDHAARD